MLVALSKRSCQNAIIKNHSEYFVLGFDSSIHHVPYCHISSQDNLCVLTLSSHQKHFILTNWKWIFSLNCMVHRASSNVMSQRLASLFNLTYLHCLYGAKIITLILIGPVPSAKTKYISTSPTSRPDNARRIISLLRHVTVVFVMPSWRVYSSV
jgi:hypothetical protein